MNLKLAPSHRLSRHFCHCFELKNHSFFQDYRVVKLEESGFPQTAKPRRQVGSIERGTNGFLCGTARG